MIERYTIKFGPAVSQKELHVDGDLSKAHHLKARIELIGEAEKRSCAEPDDKRRRNAFSNS